MQQHMPILSPCSRPPVTWGFSGGQPACTTGDTPILKQNKSHAYHFKYTKNPPSGMLLKFEILLMADVLEEKQHTFIQQIQRFLSHKTQTSLLPFHVPLWREVSCTRQSCSKNYLLPKISSKNENETDAFTEHKRGQAGCGGGHRLAWTA